MDIVVCPDKNFVMPTGVLMQSVCANNKDSVVNFHIICDESIEERHKEDLKSVICRFINKRVLFYNIDGIKFDEMPALDNAPVTKAAYYRLELAGLLPESINKVLYLDGDIIVRKSIEELYNTDISNYALAAVPDNNIGLNLRSGYFNSGVMLINLKYWREHNLREDYYRFIQEHPDMIRFWDQDVLNYVLKEQKLLLPVKYNLVCGWLWRNCGSNSEDFKDELDDAIKDPVIIHFTTPNKPWTTICRHPYKNLFLKYKSQTIWKDTPLQEKRPLKLRIIKFFSGILRKYKLIPELSPYGKEFLPNLKPLE